PEGRGQEAEEEEDRVARRCDENRSPRRDVHDREEAVDAQDPIPELARGGQQAGGARDHRDSIGSGMLRARARYCNPLQQGLVAGLASTFDAATIPDGGTLTSDDDVERGRPDRRGMDADS